MIVMIQPRTTASTTSKRNGGNIYTKTTRMPTRSEKEPTTANRKGQRFATRKDILLTLVAAGMLLKHVLFNDVTILQATKLSSSRTINKNFTKGSSNQAEHYEHPKKYNSDEFPPFWSMARQPQGIDDEDYNNNIGSSSSSIKWRAPGKNHIATVERSAMELLAYGMGGVLPYYKSILPALKVVVVADQNNNTLDDENQNLPPLHVEIAEVPNLVDVALDLHECKVGRYKEKPTLVLDEYEDYDWRAIDLPQWIRTAAKGIGYTRRKWDYDKLPNTMLQDWDSLTESQRESAKILGYTRETWCEDQVDCDNNKKISTAAPTTNTTRRDSTTPPDGTFNACFYPDKLPDRKATRSSKKTHKDWRTRPENAGYLITRAQCYKQWGDRNYANRLHFFPNGSPGHERWSCDDHYFMEQLVGLQVLDYIVDQGDRFFPDRTNNLFILRNTGAKNEKKQFVSIDHQGDYGSFFKFVSYEDEVQLKMLLDYDLPRGLRNDLKQATLRSSYRDFVSTFNTSIGGRLEPLNQIFAEFWSSFHPNEEKAPPSVTEMLWKRLNEVVGFYNITIEN